MSLLRLRVAHVACTAFRNCANRYHVDEEFSSSLRVYRSAVAVRVSLCALVYSLCVDVCLI